MSPHSRPALQFHQATFDMLERTPKFSKRLATSLEQVEGRTDRRMPASVREWYYLEGAGRHLRHFRRHLLISEWEEPCYSRLDHQPPLIAFGKWKHGAFFVALDDSDDPPVFADCNPNDKRHRIADHFSTTMFLWATQTWGSDHCASLSIPAATSACLDFLKETFQEGTLVGAAGWHHSFFSPGCWIHLQTFRAFPPRPEEYRVDLRASSADRLRGVVKQLWLSGLFGPTPDYSGSPAAMLLLNALWDELYPSIPRRIPAPPVNAPRRRSR